LWTEFRQVVSEKGSLVAGARDGVEQVRMDAGVRVNEDALRSEALRAVTGDGVAVVEMTMLASVELDLAVVVEASGKAAVGMDGLDDGKFAVSNAERFARAVN
jgi:hypothetical protein